MLLDLHHTPNQQLNYVNNEYINDVNGKINVINIINQEMKKHALQK